AHRVSADRRSTVFPFIERLRLALVHAAAGAAADRSAARAGSGPADDAGGLAPVAAARHELGEHPRFIHALAPGAPGARAVSAASALVRVQVEANPANRTVRLDLDP